MRKFFHKSYRWAIVFTVLLVGSFAFVMLDTFVIPKTYQAVIPKATAQNYETSSDSLTSDSLSNTDAQSTDYATTNQEGPEDTTTDSTGTTGDSTTSNTTLATDSIASTDGTVSSEETTSTEGTGNSTSADNNENSSHTDIISASITDNSTSSNSSTNAYNTNMATFQEPIITDNSYEDANIKINIETIHEYDSNIYIADIQLSDPSYLQTALAMDTYGRNVKETTSEIAEDHDAIFAINGDYYGFRDYGYVLRNGTLFRDSASDMDTLVIDQNGDFSILDSNESLDTLNLNAIWQILSFGPALIEDGEIVVDSNSEVGRAKSSNPRTAIGQISELHYIIIVSDGRTDESAGLSLLQLAQVFADKGCVTAYNLDGGGSSTMYFNGEIVNVPTDGRGIGEREVSDIVYIGY